MLILKVFFGIILILVGFIFGIGISSKSNTKNIECPSRYRFVNGAASCNPEQILQKQLYTETINELKKYFDEKKKKEKY